ncbi:MAG: hypothetical protein EOM24_29940 [Chloroflexia bacterium]|nr:hypothetical protein [Chloroflexia bacterium]
MFEIQERVIESILGDVEQQEAVAVVNKPISEEQTLISQVLQEYLNNPDYDRRELREYRKFLKQPLVGASIQRLRQALQSFSTSNEVGILIEVVRDLYQQQSEAASPEEGHRRTANRIRRDDLKLMCYEYIYA